MFFFCLQRWPYTKKDTHRTPYFLALPSKQQYDDDDNDDVDV
jgi:hypothetical protein